MASLKQNRYLRMQPKRTWSLLACRRTGSDGSRWLANGEQPFEGAGDWNEHWQVFHTRWATHFLKVGMDPCRERPGDVAEPWLWPDSRLSVSKANIPSGSSGTSRYSPLLHIPPRLSIDWHLISMVMLVWRSQGERLEYDRRTMQIEIHVQSSRELLYLQKKTAWPIKIVATTLICFHQNSHINVEFSLRKYLMEQNSSAF